MKNYLLLFLTFATTLCLGMDADKTKKVFEIFEEKVLKYEEQLRKQDPSHMFSKEYMRVFSKSGYPNFTTSDSKIFRKHSDYEQITAARLYMIKHYDPTKAKLGKKQ